MSAAAAIPALLTRAVDTEHGFPGMGPMGVRFARGLQDIFAAAGCSDAVLLCEPSTIKSYAQWRSAQTGFTAVCRYQMIPLKGSVLLAFPAALIARLVDLYYGGTGDIKHSGMALTAAESLFMARIADQCLPVFEASWRQVIAVNLTLTGIETDAADLALINETELVLVQAFTLSSRAMPSVTVECAYPATSLRSIAALSKAGMPTKEIIIDPVWRDRMMQAVMQAHVPMRYVFARPEIPLSQLLTLAKGDVIPVTLPRHLPVSVAGRLFAHGSVGEANGRAAIKIEKLEEGICSYE